jgi:hypothetical protein
METEIITMYVLSDDLLKLMGIREDIQVKMNNAEVITVVLTAARFFCGHIENTRVFLKEQGYIPDMLSESRLNRRIHEINASVWVNMFFILSETFKEKNSGQEYIADSFPVQVCQNIRISRSKIYKGESYRGFIPCKRLYFYGLRVHMIVTGSGEPVEFMLAPGAESDVTVYKQFNFDLPDNSVCYGDKAYNDYDHEDMLKETAGISFRPTRKKNSLRATDSHIERTAHRTFRKRIETAFSKITALFPKCIHAVTQKGFELKVISFIIAAGIQYLM